MVPKPRRKKGEFKTTEGVFVRYYDDSKAYKVWIPRTYTLIRSRDVIFDETNHIEHTTIHGTDNDDLPSPWTVNIPISNVITLHTPSTATWTDDQQLPFHENGDSMHTPTI